MVYKFYSTLIGKNKLNQIVLKIFLQDPCNLLILFPGQSFRSLTLSFTTNFYQNENACIEKPHFCPPDVEYRRRRHDQLQKRQKTDL